MTEPQQRALAILARMGRVPPHQLTPETELVADLGFDSARALEFVVDLEDALGIEIDDEAAGRMNTVGDVLAELDRLPPAP